MKYQRNQIAMMRGLTLSGPRLLVVCTGQTCCKRALSEQIEMDDLVETVLFTHSRLNVINRDNYVFTHTSNSIVYLLPYRCPQQGAYLLGRFEACPAHSQQIELYAITGQCEEGTDPLHVALRELHEEAGILATPSQLVSLGTGYLTKQADTVAYFFTINITDIPRSKAPTDGSPFEQSGYCDWVSRGQALAARCVGLQALLARAHL